MKRLFKYASILMLFLSIFGCSTYYYNNKDFTYKWDESKGGWLVTGVASDSANLLIPKRIINTDSQGKRDIVVGIDDYAFADNKKIKRLFLNDNIKYIGKGAFENSTLEGTLDLKNITHLSDRAFNKTNLTLIKIPKTLVKMGRLSINPSEQVKDQLLVTLNMFEDGKTNLPLNKDRIIYNYDRNWFDKESYNNPDKQLKFLVQFSISQAPYLEVNVADAPVVLTIETENESDKNVTWQRVDSESANNVITSSDPYVNFDLSTGTVSFKSKPNNDNDSITLRATSVNPELEPAYIVIKARAFYENNLDLLDTSDVALAAITKLYVGDLHDPILNANNKFKFKVKKSFNSDPAFTYTAKSSNPSIAAIDTSAFSNKDKEYTINHSAISANTRVDFTVSSSSIPSPKTTSVIYVEEITVNNLPTVIELGRDVTLDVKENNELTEAEFYLIQSGVEKDIKVGKNTIKIEDTNTGNVVIRTVRYLDGVKYYKDYNIGLSFTPVSEIAFLNDEYSVIVGNSVDVEVQRFPGNSTEPISIELENSSDSNFVRADKTNYKSSTINSVTMPFIGLLYNRYPMKINANTPTGKHASAQILVKRVPEPITSVYLNDNIFTLNNSDQSPVLNNHNALGSTDIDPRVDYSKFEIIAYSNPNTATTELGEATYTIKPSDPAVKGISIEKDYFTGIEYLVVNNKEFDNTFKNDENDPNFGLELNISINTPLSGNKTLYTGNIYVRRPKLEAITIDPINEIEFDINTFEYPSRTYNINITPKYSIFNESKLTYTPNSSTNTVVLNNNTRQLTFSPKKAGVEGGILRYDGAKDLNVSLKSIKYLVNNRDNKSIDINEELKRIVSFARQLKGHEVDLNQLNTNLVTDLSDLFMGGVFTGTLDEWDTSNVVLANRTFERIRGLKNPIFDLSSIKSMQRMFYDARIDYNIFQGEFRAENAINLEEIFASAGTTPVAKKLKFNVPKAENITGAFSNSGIEDVEFVYMPNLMYAESLFAYNQHYKGDSIQTLAQSTSKIRSFNHFFYLATKFNGPGINSFDTRSATDFSYMFDKAQAFNQPIYNFNLRNAVNLTNMFASATKFNQRVNGPNWVTSNVKLMKGMFANASAFNQDVSKFDTRNVTDMSSMFAGAVSFQGLSNNNTWIWNVNNVEKAVYLFATTPALDGSTLNGFLLDDMNNAWNFKKLYDYTGMFKNSGVNTANIATFTFPVKNRYLILDDMFNGANRLTFVIDNNVRATRGKENFIRSLNDYFYYAGVDEAVRNRVSSYERMYLNAKNISGSTIQLNDILAKNSIITKYSDQSADMATNQSTIEPQLRNVSNGSSVDFYSLTYWLNYKRTDPYPFTYGKEVADYR